MSNRAYDLCLTAALYEVADRLSFLGYQGDGLKDFIVFILNESDLHAYHDVVAASDAAGFDPFIDRKSWSGRDLPSVKELPLLPEALTASVTKYLDSAGSYSFDARGRFKGSGR